MLLALLLGNFYNVIIAVGAFDRGELSLCVLVLQEAPRVKAVAVLLRGQHLLPGERRVMSRMTTEQRPPLPVVGPHLQDGLFEWPCGQRVQDRVKGTVNGENKNNHPGTDGA